MFCPGCGTDNPAQAVFCYKCGAQMPQAVAGQGFVLPGQPVAAGAAAAPQPGYLWGYIQGWAMLVGSPLFFLLFTAVLLKPDSDAQTREGSVMFMVLLALGAITGLGLVRRMKLGLRLVYVWAGLHVAFAGIGVLAIIGAPGSSDIRIAMVLILVGLVFWMLCAAYYHKRHTLFH